MAQILDFVAQSYQALSKPLNCSRCVNFFPELETQDSKSKTPVPVWGAPGISPYAECASGPVKALHVMNDQLYAVSGSRLYQVATNGATTDLGEWALQDNVSIDDNGTQIVAVDGWTGWQYSETSGCAQIVDPNFVPASTVAYFDGYFCFDRRYSIEFFLSPLFAVTPFDGAMFASKEATSDRLLAVVNSHEQLYLFGERRTEVWYDAGNSPPTFPFQRSDGAIIQRGLIGPYATVLEDNTIFFLGEDGIFYRLDGFVPERVSNPSVETVWQSYGDISTTRIFSYTWIGHKFLVLLFPIARATWVFDISTRRWHERESWLGTSADDSIGRWRVNCAVNYNGMVLVGDSQSGKIGQLNPNVYTEWGDTIRGMIVGPEIHKDRRRCFMKRFEIDVETGVGVTATPEVVSTTYCAQPIEMVRPVETASGGALSSVASTFPYFLFSGWFYMPDDADTRGVWFSNQTSDSSPGTGGFQLGIFNDNSSAANFQLLVRLYDSAGAAILEANYADTAWTNWTWVGVSGDCVSKTLQVYVNHGSGDTALTAAAITWSSANPAANSTAWHLVPSGEP